MSIHRVLILLPIGSIPIKDIIEQVFKARGISALGLIRGQTGRDESVSLLKRSIELADDIVADLSGNNPNIMYEVGYAHGIRKRVLLIVNQQEANLPVDITGHLFFSYHCDAPNFDILKSEIDVWASHLIRAKRIADLTECTEAEPEEPEPEPEPEEPEPEEPEPQEFEPEEFEPEEPEPQEPEEPEPEPEPEEPEPEEFEPEEFEPEEPEPQEPEEPEPEPEQEEPEPEEEGERS